MSALDLIDEFLSSPLFSWFESCLPRPESLKGYSSLLDGHLINSVFIQIDPEPTNHLVKISDEDGAALATVRSRNIDAVVKNLRSIYEEELGQTILTLPDCFTIGNFPETKNGVEQIKLLLTLLLGAAVQCPNKQLFIARITELDIKIQHGIVEVIKHVTESQTLVLTMEFPENIHSNLMVEHIKRLAKERDKYHNSWIAVLNSENEMTTNQLQKNSTSLSSNAASTPESQHLAVELADLKSKMRRIRQELEEKTECFIETREELEHTRSQYEKLKNESQDWYSEARQAATYRDEVDILREKADRVERLEIEIQRFREKLSDVEFYKTRVEELREDNRMITETKEMLEEQLLHARKRSEQVMSLESEILKYKQKMNDIALERDIDKSKMQELIDENTQLQLTTKNLMSGAENIAKAKNEIISEISTNDSSLSEQLTNNAQTRALKLELENRRLLATIESLEETNFKENSSKVLELEKDRKKMSLKCDQLQDTCDRINQQNTELEDVFKNALIENKKLQDIIDNKQQQIERTAQDKETEKLRIQDLEAQIDSLTKEKERIHNLSDSIQKRANDSEKSLQSKAKEFEILKERTSEFDNFKKELSEIRSKLGFVEKENISLSKELLKTKENLEKKELEVDTKNESIEKLNLNLSEKHEELNLVSQNVQKVQEIEKRNQELISQNKIDIETIKNLQKQIVNDTIVAEKFQKNLEKIGIEKMELDKSELNAEYLIDKLIKNPDSFKTVCEIMLIQNKKSSGVCVLCNQKEIYTVEKDIQFTRVEELDDGMLKLKENFDHLQIEFNALNGNNTTLQAENARKKVEVSTMSSQITSLNSQQLALQLANTQLVAEKDVLTKNIDSVRNQHKTTLQDLTTLQCLHEQLNSDYDAINKEKEILRNTIRDLKIENRNFNDRLDSNDKTIEELRSEIEILRKGSVSLNNLRAEHSKLKDDFRNLFTTNDRLKREYKNIQEQYKLIRSENGRLKLQTTEQSGEMNNRLDHMSSLEIELTKSKQQCEMLLSMNQSLDTDRRTLMDHVSQLLSQYHELLTHSLEDKQHYHTEEKNFTDKVNDLKRQKEKLEEKIMEHYRKLDSCSPKKKPVVANFVRKVKKAGTDLMNKTKNRRSWIEDPRLTQSQILGSESGENESDNSIEEQVSAVSDNTNLRRDSQIRHSFQKKTSEQIHNVLLRGGIRASLQAVKKTDEHQANRNSFSGSFEAPTESIGALGAAGSRRTVYMGMEQPNEEPSTSNGKTEGSAAPTFLMYNKISTTISGAESPPLGSIGNDNQKSKNDNKKKTDQKNRESAIWYEYGCV